MKLFVNPVEERAKSGVDNRFFSTSNTAFKSKNDNPGISHEDPYLINKLENIEKCLVQLMGNTNEIKENEDTELKWKFAALVMDRSFFYLTLIYFIITFIALVMSSTNFYMGSG